MNTTHTHDPRPFGSERPEASRWALAIVVAALGVAALALASFAQSASAQTNGTTTATTTGTTTGQVSGTVLNATTTATSTPGGGTGTTTATTTPGGGTGTTTATTTATTTLENRILILEMRIAALQTEVDQLRARIDAMGHGAGTTTPGGGMGTSTSAGMNSPGVTVTPQNATVRAGTSVDLNGRGFGADEQVYVTENGIIMSTARADSAGNFSTGSLPVGSATGTFTVKLVGATSNKVGWATVTVTP